jgi:hypothetical protein
LFVVTLRAGAERAFATHELLVAYESFVVTEPFAEAAESFVAAVEAAESFAEAVVAPFDAEAVAAPFVVAAAEAAGVVEAAEA